MTRTKEPCRLGRSCYPDNVARQLTLGLTLVLLIGMALGVTAKAQSVVVKKSSAARSGDAKPWLGVGFRGSAGGVLVDEVIPDSPADIAGILVGDVVVAVGAIGIRMPNHLVSSIQKYSVGDGVVVSVRRKGRLLRLKTELASFLSPAELLRRRLVDRDAPVFSLPVVHGEAEGDFTQHSGKVVVLEFWSSWCAACKASFEPLANLEAAYLGELVVLTITADRDSQLARFHSGYAMPLPVLHDPERRVHQAYHYEQSVPTIVVIGRDGLVRYADTGSTLNLDSVLLSAKRAVRELD